MITELKEYRDTGKFEKAFWRVPEDQKDLENMLKDPYAYFMSRVSQNYDNRIYLTDTLNSQFSQMGFYHVLRSFRQVVIYGAGKVGRYVAERLRAIGVEENKLFFAVTDIQGIESRIDNIPVKQIDEIINRNEDCLVLVSAKGEKQIVMLNNLKNLGGQNIIVVDNEVSAYLASKDNI